MTPSRMLFSILTLIVGIVKVAVDADLPEKDSILSLFQSGNIEEATQKMNTLNHKDLFSLARTLTTGDHKYKEALICFDEAIIKASQEGAENPEYYRERAHCHMDMGRPTDAIPDTQKCVELKPESSDCWYSFIYAMRESGQPLSELGGVRILDDDQIASLGHTFCTLQFYMHAIFLFDTAIKKNPSKVSHYWNRGECYWLRQSSTNAFNNFELALAKDPSNEDYRIRLTEKYLDRRKYSDAIRVLSEWRSENLKNNLEGLCNQLFVDSLNDEAVSCYTEAIKLNPDNALPLYYKRRGLCNAKIGNDGSAISDLRTYMTKQPIDYPPQLDLCELLVKIKSYDEANKSKRYYS